MRKFFLLAFALSCLGMSAQKNIEVADCPSYNTDNTSARVVRVTMMADTICMVRVDIISMENKQSYVPKINGNTRLIVGSDTFSLVGVQALKQGSSYPTCDQRNGVYYWKEFKKDHVYSCIAMFNARIPKGTEKISLWHPDLDFYQFREVTIENPVTERDQKHYLAYTKKRAKVYQSADGKSAVLEMVDKGAAVVMDSPKGDEAYCKVRVVNTSTAGYISRKDIKGKAEGVAIEKDLFNLSSINNQNEAPKVEIFNNSSVVLTITFGTEEYQIQPRSKETITVKGECRWFMVKTLGTLPTVCTQELKAGQTYWWEFKFATLKF